MNETIFNNWCEIISNDIIFFLGDFVIGHSNKYNTTQILWDSLPGRKYFLKGSHDEHTKKYTNIPVIEDKEIQVKYKNINILMTHEPVWNFDRTKYNLHIFGHIHNNKENEKVDKTCMKNVSVEMVGYKPIHIDNILKELHYEF
jgi:calcineurin-like phosphoesterase family protein